MNRNTIQYWHKLEHFYPYILEDQHNDKIKTYHITEERNFPDFTNPDIPENKEVRYYEVYLGIFKVDSAMEVIAKQLKAQNEFREESDEESCFCKFQISADGVFDHTSFKISSFPWAIQKVRDGKINLESWDEEFQCYQRALFLEFFASQSQVTYKQLKETLDFIGNDIGWEIRFSKRWLRIDRIIGEKKSFSEKADVVENEKADTEIETENVEIDELIKANDLLNSFYIRDLEKLIFNINNQKFGNALEGYVDHKIIERIDIEKDKNVLFDVFDPKNMPYGKWPSGFPLRSMQQVAVTLFMDRKRLTQNIFSVNGPPGTGKTTLLRDVIAANVVERAFQLLKFEKPDDAFEEKVEIVEYKGFKNRVKDLKSELKAYGILVASNNNAAVKNITTELPEKDAIAPKYQEHTTYFHEVSDSLLGKETWGMCAAALGNKRNCHQFIETFWPIKAKEQDGFDFNVYLRNLHTGDKHRQPEECKALWQEAKDRFNILSEKLNLEYNKLNGCYENMRLLKAKLAERKEQEKAIEREKQQVVMLQNEKMAKEETYRDSIKALERYAERKKEIKDTVTFFKLKYVLKFKGVMLEEYHELEKKAEQILTQKFALENEIASFSKKLDLAEKDWKQELLKNKDLDKKISEVKANIESFKKEYDGLLPDEEYLSDFIGENGEEHRKFAQNIAPWNGEKLNELRERLFIEAMNLHQVFVENSPQMRIQLDALGKLMRNLISTNQAKSIAGVLFQSLMLVVPVISTTFASVGSFLKYIGKEEFGLLLIDEAGQALPQSAAGAIWRAKKVLVVGDPLQIDPVVTIHDKTIQFLQQYFAQTDFIANKETSVQSLADEANRYAGLRTLGDKEFWVGAPLLVHGRCQHRIFDIANKIAYNEKMIYATKTKANTNCCWIDVKGRAENQHFVPEQVDKILPIIKNAFLDHWEANGFETYPSLFLITPFRSVKAGVKRSLNATLYEQLSDHINEFSKRSIRKWINTNIGTIHTFQGKEAQTVILCLGVDSGNKGAGAIHWASEKPNILNVAVTRAKDNLYIIGDVKKWASQDYFKQAYELCDK